ncbi:MAG: DUF4350 domain-containing protein [Daejeonella sp.]
MKEIRVYLLISAVLLIAYLLVQYYEPKPTNWAPSYLKEDKIPFGEYILHQRLKDIMPGTRIKVSDLPVYNTLKNKKYRKSTYLIIASEVKFDKLDYEQLVKFMKSGNDVFIAGRYLDQNLEDTLKLHISEIYPYYIQGQNSDYPVNFTNPALKSNKDYLFDKNTGSSYFNKIDTARATVLGTNRNGFANFVKYKFGKGALYVMPNPQIFSNYNLLKTQRAEYAAKALSYLSPGGELIWDEYNTRGKGESQSILRVFFKHKELRWAYYIAIFSLLFYVLFEVKRRQRIIPLIDPLRNTSVEFAEVVGQVYYQQRNNRDIAEKKISYLLEYIRSKYRLKTLDLDDEFIEILIKKTGAAEETIRPLFVDIQTIQRGEMVSDSQLINLNKLIEQFYKQDQ